MRVIAVDPGETIGLALYDSETDDFIVTQVSDVWDAEDWIWAEAYDLETCNFVMENYISSGHLSKPAFNTIKILGRLEGYLQRDYGYPYKLVAPQARLAYVDQATALIGDDAKDMHRKGRDAIAALAHAISHSRSTQF